MERNLSALMNVNDRDATVLICVGGPLDGEVKSISAVEVERAGGLPPLVHTTITEPEVREDGSLSGGVAYFQHRYEAAQFALDGEFFPALVWEPLTREPEDGEEDEYEAPRETAARLWRAHAERVLAEAYANADPVSKHFADKPPSPFDIRPSLDGLESMFAEVRKVPKPEKAAPRRYSVLGQTKGL